MWPSGCAFRDASSGCARREASPGVAVEMRRRRVAAEMLSPGSGRSDEFSLPESLNFDSQRGENDDKQ